MWFWVLFVIGWVGSCLIAYRIMETTWLLDWDLTRADRRVFVVLSAFGPISVLAGVLIHILRVNDASKRGEDVIKHKGRA